MNDLDKIEQLMYQQVGTKENGNNNVIYNTHYYGGPVTGDAYPWCCAFIWDVFRMAGLSGLFCGGEKTAYCPYVVNWAKSHGQWVTGDYRRGDLLLYDWNGDKKADHIGFCTDWNGSSGHAIEGNCDNMVAKVSRYSSQILGALRPPYKTESEAEPAPPAEDSGTDDGKPWPGAVENEDYYVAKKYDNLWSIAQKFLGSGSLYSLLKQINDIEDDTIYPGQILILHPAEQEQTKPPEDQDDGKQEDDETPAGGAYIIGLRVLADGSTGSDVRQMQRLLIATGYKLPKYGADGEFGKETESAVRSFQRDNGIPQTGAADKPTMTKLLGL